MGIKKVLLISVSTIGTIGVVSGAGVGIAHAVQQNQSQSEEMEHVPGTKPIPVRPGKMDNKNPAGTSTDGMNSDQKDPELSDDPNSHLDNQNELEKQLTPQEIADSLTATNVVIHPYKTDEHNSTTTLDKQSVIGNIKEVLAYLIKQEQLDIKPTQKNQKNLSFKIELEEEKNTVKALNDGELHIKVTVSKQEDPKKEAETSKPVSIKLTGFKKASSKIKSDLKISEDTYQLTLLNKDYSSIENLNLSSMHMIPKKSESKNVTGLTNVLWTQTGNDSIQNIGNYLIKGEVKLEAIEKDTSKENAPIFVLTAANKNNPLVVVKTLETNKTQEVLVDKIKINNLLATDITVQVKTKDDTLSNSLVEALKKDNTEETGFVLNNEDKSKLNREIAINLADKQTPNLLFVKADGTRTTVTSEDDAKLDLVITISFGQGQNIKQYKTSDPTELSLIKETGFSFDIYSKKLEENGLDITAKKLKESQSNLESYFKQEIYTKFVTRPEIAEMEKEEETRKSNGNFHVVNVTDSGLDSISFDMEKSRDGKKLTEIKTDFMGNYLVFVNYSYKGVAEKMASITPSISLIHVQQQEGQ